LQKEQLLALVEEGFQKTAWHGPNLRSALRGVNADEAAWRPAKGRHNIWEIAVHTAYWKFIVTRRLIGSKKQDFPEKGRNWFVRDGAKFATDEASKRWKSDLSMLVDMHYELCSAIASLKEPGLKHSKLDNRQSVIRNIVGIAMHDVYHAGQIRLLRKMYGDKAQ
jgi:hypothetical protein